MHTASRLVPLNRYSAYGPYWFDDLKQAYTRASDRVFDGRGATIGMPMSSDMYDCDKNTDFANENDETISGKELLSLQRETVLGGSRTSS